MINAETSDSASGGNLWHTVRDRWRARRAERETKTHRTAAWRVEGRRDDGGHEFGVERERQGQTHRREAAQRRPQDSLRPITTSSGSQRRSLHVLDDQVRGTRVQETEGAIARQLGAGDIKGKGTRPWPPGIAAFTGLLQALSERGNTVGASNAAGWQTSSKYGTIWSWRGHSTWYPTASWPKFTTLFCAVSSSSSAWQSIENTFVGQSDKQERIVFSVKLQTELWNGHSLHPQSNRVEKK